MRDLLLATTALLSATAGMAIAQTPPNPLQGQYAAPLAGGPAANNNLNLFGTAQLGSAPAPAPGTVIIRLNGRLYADFDLNYGTGFQTAKGTIVPASGAAPNSAGYKLNPVGTASYFRLYPGIDGVATNGLRYGAAVEIRENFEGGNNFAVSAAPTTVPGSSAITTTLPSGTATSGTAASASGNSSAETLYVRRAFAYLGSDQLGIIRLGQADGLSGIYDATGIFTIGSWDVGMGNLNGSAGLQAEVPNEYVLSWPFITNSGPDYGNNKIVYLSPQFFGFDLGLEYDPNQGNVFSNSVTSSPYQVGPCNTASANCVSVTSGTDSSRWINRFGFGARYIGSFGPVDLKGYATYYLSGHADAAGMVQAGPADLKAHPAVAGLAGGGSSSSILKYDGQSVFNGGVAVSYLGLTVNADVSDGRENGSNGLDPTGGVPVRAELAGISYTFGPIAIGAVGAIIDSQGAAQLTGTSQRHEFAVATGGSYKIAPGLALVIEYQYEQKHQGAYNFNTGAAGVPTGNNIRVQGLTFATIVTW
jgi:predicted porin